MLRNTIFSRVSLLAKIHIWPTLSPAFSTVINCGVQLMEAALLRAGCTGTASAPPNAVYTLGPDSFGFPQTQPWVSYDTRSPGTVSITSDNPRRGDGSLRLFTTGTADKAQVGACLCDPQDHPIFHSFGATSHAAVLKLSIVCTLYVIRTDLMACLTGCQQ